MRKLRKSKKGQTDTAILIIISAIYILSGLFLADVATSFGVTATVTDADGTIQQVKENTENPTALTPFKVLTTMLKLALIDWDGSMGLPLWVQAIYTLLAVGFIISLASMLLP